MILCRIVIGLAILFEAQHSRNLLALGSRPWSGPTPDRNERRFAWRPTKILCRVAARHKDDLISVNEHIKQVCWTMCVEVLYQESKK